MGFKHGLVNWEPRSLWKLEITVIAIMSNCIQDTVSDVSSHCNLCVVATFLD